MRSFLPLVAAAILGLSGIGHADTINTYNVSETYFIGSATGSVTLDATTGVFTASNIAFTSTAGNATFNGTPTSAVDMGTYNKIVFGSSTPGASLSLFLPVDSLVNYAGGNVCTLTSTAACGGNYSNVALLGVGVDGVNSGTLTLASSTTTPVAVTPEPTSLILLGTGVLGIGAMMRRRRI